MLGVQESLYLSIIRSIASIAKENIVNCVFDVSDDNFDRLILKVFYYIKVKY